MVFGDVRGRGLVVGRTEPENEVLETEFCEDCVVLCELEKPVERLTPPEDGAVARVEFEFDHGDVLDTVWRVVGAEVLELSAGLIQELGTELDDWAEGVMYG